jgi:hypothetical protein
MEDWLATKLNERQADGQRWHVITAASGVAVGALVIFTLLHGLARLH